MKLKFEIIPYTLHFTFTAGTSRGSFTEKETWTVKAYDPAQPNLVAWGEVSPLKGLSEDYTEDFEAVLTDMLQELASLEIPESADEILMWVTEQIPADFPSIRFGLETVLLDYVNGCQFKIFDNQFWQGKKRTPINGLIWMGEESFMQEQIEAKLKAGFNTIKMKIGAIDFDTEFKLLESIRQSYSAHEITLRVDANGAFDESNVRERLTDLASLEIHSIEQPIKPGQWGLMAELCAEGLLPIALDEELIGVHSLQDKVKLLDTIKPQYIILKPSLVGGIRSCQEWIDLAEERGIGWWMTSMLESNIGLNAIAQFTAEYENLLPQGLGTGQLYHNNFESPLEIRKGELLYNQPKGWEVSF
ncbi:o-succinylbenzoate synthase [Roseivirga sp.]|uniref:o-succinylbenzoate synthase n=1 Tax=Roseivirga sp. TaxID=1964215 RepID=UPI003B5290A3